MATQLSDLSISRLRRMLVATERAVGTNSVSAQIIRQTIAAKLAKQAGGRDAK